jgi:hypothetical protein
MALKNKTAIDKLKTSTEIISTLPKINFIYSKNHFILIYLQYKIKI